MKFNLGFEKCFPGGYFFLKMPRPLWQGVEKFSALDEDDGSRSEERLESLPVVPLAPGAGVPPPPRFESFSSHPDWPVSDHRTTQEKTLFGFAALLMNNNPGIVFDAWDLVDKLTSKIQLSRLARCLQAKNLLLSAYMERDMEEQEEILNEKLDLAERQKKFQPLSFQVVEMGFPFDGTWGQSWPTSLSFSGLQRRRRQVKFKVYVKENWSLTLWSGILASTRDPSFRLQMPLQRKVTMRRTRMRLLRIPKAQRKRENQTAGKSSRVFCSIQGFSLTVKARPSKSPQRSKRPFTAV